MDKCILGQEVYLVDEDIGNLRPNDNEIINGATGTGKTMSIFLPTILNTKNKSLIVSLNKRAEAWKLVKYKSSKGYRTYVCDLVNPDDSTGVIDPLRHSVASYLDCENLAKSIVFADPASKSEKEYYWNNAATSLLYSLMLVAMMVIDNATMTDVLNLFDALEIKEDGKGITTTLDDLYDNVEIWAGKCPAVTAFVDYRQLPYTTAGCIRDSLAQALRRAFPESIRRMMSGDKLIDFEEVATKKTMLMIITSPVNTSLYLFADLVFGIAIKQLLEFAERCEGQHLPLPVKLMFDDFACGAKINDFSKHISIFRSAGISTMMLLQSESQLRQMYTDAESENILNNCSVYAYLTGGMDLVTCRNISKRLDVPLTDILYAPMGQVIVMQAGKKPVRTRRYDTLSSREYIEYAEKSSVRKKEKMK